MRSKASKRPTDAKIIRALRKSRGLVSQAAKQLGVNEGTIRRRIARSPALKKQQDAIIEAVLDEVEAKLIELAASGHPSVVKFHLSHRSAAARRAKLRRIHLRAAA